MTDQDSCRDRTWRSLVEGIESAVKADGRFRAVGHPL